MTHPALKVDDGIQNADGTYAMKATVSVSEPTVTVKTSNGADENICKYDKASAERFLNGEKITDAKSLCIMTLPEGANNGIQLCNQCVRCSHG